jgi:hypothetical protein
MVTTWHRCVAALLMLTPAQAGMDPSIAAEIDGPSVSLFTIKAVQ